MSKRFFIELSYNGAAYHGWQVQPNAVTVQEILQKMFSVLLGRKIDIIGCGRTDTGVHARNFIAHFDFENNDPVSDKFRFKINCMLPTDIAIHRIFEVNNDAHSRFNALSRTYRYYISTQKDPFNDALSWFCSYELNFEAMQQAAKVLFDYENFASFCKSRAGSKTTLCTIMEANWEIENGKLIFTIKANRFLRNMVRAIVGTCIDVARGKKTVDDVRKIIESKDRSKAGFSVPPNGLFLDEITYPEWIVS